MLTDVQIARLAERGGWRWWLFIAMAYAGLVVEKLPIVITLKRYGELRECEAIRDDALRIVHSRPSTHTEICKNENCPRGGKPIEVLD